jgi:hypothetical protein
VKKAFTEGQFPKGYSPNVSGSPPQSGPFGGFGGFNSRNVSDDSAGEIIDAEEVRRVQ